MMVQAKCLSQDRGNVSEVTNYKCRLEQASIALDAQRHRHASKTTFNNIGCGRYKERTAQEENIFTVSSAGSRRVCTSSWFIHARYTNIRYELLHICVYMYRYMGILSIQVRQWKWEGWLMCVWRYIRDNLSSSHSLSPPRSLSLRLISRLS